MMDATYTAEQLRRDAIAIERMHGETLTVEWRGHQASQLRAHAAALEENARLTRECEFHAKQCARVDELRHRAEAELAKLRQHAEAMERYKAFVDWMSLYGATVSVVADERGSLRLDWYRGTVFGGSMDELMQALDDKIAAYRADFPGVADTPHPKEGLK